MFGGILISEAYSKDLKGFELLKNYFLVLIDLEFISKQDALEAFHYSLANFLDQYIDYPKSADFAHELIDTYTSLGIIQDPLIYKEHIANVQKDVD